MDKYEYKVRADEIKALIEEGDYVQAADIADTIDWRRVKSVTMLCTISDLYKINKRYEDAKNMLLLAYERRPGGRTICYSLCGLCIKTEEYVQAINYYKEFVQASPKDPARYILQYRLYEAQDVSLEERIGVLEELKKRDYREKWAYELAFLYHKVGMATRCVAECDELFLWFGKGKYVIKAMELKMLHESLTPEQQEMYDHRFDDIRQEIGSGEENYPQQAESQWNAYGQQSEGQWDAYGQEQESQWNGQDMQQPEGQWDAYGQEQEDQWNGQDIQQPEGQWDAYGQEQESQWNGQESQQSEDQWGEQQTDQMLLNGMEAEDIPVTEPPEDMDIHVKTVDVGQFNTLNLQAELAAGLQEVLEADKREPQPSIESENRVGQDKEQLEDQAEQNEEQQGNQEIQKRLTNQEENQPGNRTEQDKEQKAYQAKESEARQNEKLTEQSRLPQEQQQIPDKETAKFIMEQMRKEALALAIQPPKELAGVLSQEADGQISIVLPEWAAIEKQITGQIKIEDIMSELDRMIKENQEKYQEDVRQRVLQQTGPMFTEFEQAVRNGFLEKLENGETESGSNQAPEVREASAELDAREQIARELAELQAAKEKAARELAELQAAREQAERERAEREREQQEAAAREQAEREREQQEAAAREQAEREQAQQEAERAKREELAAIRAELEAARAKKAEQEAAHEQEIEQLRYPSAKAAKEWREITKARAARVYSIVGNQELPTEQEDLEAAVSVEDLDAPEPEMEKLDMAEPDAAKSDTVKLDAVKLDIADSDAAKPETAKPDMIKPDTVEPDAEMSDTGKPDAEMSDTAESDAENADTADALQFSAERNVRKGEADDTLVEREKGKARSLTREEKELFAPFVQSRSAREQLVKAVDNISLAAYTGNIIVTGDEGTDTLTLAKNMLREVQMTNSDFTGQVAKITGQTLNQRPIDEVLEPLENGALIIQKASDMNIDTATALYNALQQEHFGIIVVLEDTKKAMQKMFLRTPDLYSCFTARMDVEALSNDTLVAFGKMYAREMEYAIDELGILALHTRIEELQTIDHVVTVIEVKKIVDDAIKHAGRKTFKHFFDILFAKRYDEEDMIVLTEKDFV